MLEEGDVSTKGGDDRRSDDSAKGAVISVNILNISGGVGGGGSPPHDARRSYDSTKGDDDQRSDDSAKGALITVNLLQISGVRKVRYRFRTRRGTLARSSTDFVAGAILSEGQVQLSQQAQHFSKVRYRFAASAAFARCDPDFAARAALSQEVPISQQAQHLRRVRCRV